MRIVQLMPVMLVLAGCGDNKPGVQRDAGVDPTVDAPNLDAPPDGGDDSDGIAEARAAADGSGLDLPIRNVIVTYIKPQIGNPTNDPAGFTIQVAQTGPALFVTVDPATLTPPPEVGDVVSFTITTMGTVGMQRRAQAITDYTRVSQGADVEALVQDISAATDITSAIDNYDSELVRITGTIAQDFGFSGSGFQRAQIDTAGITGDANLQIRAPETLVAAVDMANTCTITATGPMGRFNAQAQIGVYAAADFMLSGCPAPVVTGAVASSSTQVVVTFSRNILASSVEADGSQFTFDNGLVASAATVSGRTVTVTTSAQAANAAFTLTVANTVTDLQGTAVGTPNTATFAGFVTPAVVRINEVNGNIGGTSPNQCDLIELRVVSGGSMKDFRLQERNGNGASNELSFTFPDFTVATNDIIVVHLDATSAVCNPDGATQETGTVTDQPAAMFGGNYDTAFDFWSDDNGLTATDNVITLFDAANSIIDAVFLVNGATGNVATATETAAAAVGAANQWDPALPSYLDDVFRMHAVPGLDATGNTASGDSIQRIDDTDDNNVGDWTTAPAASSFGVLNAGQTPFAN